MPLQKIVFIIFISVVFSWGSLSTGFADVPPDSFVLNQTQTRVGNEFYEQFAQRWEVFGLSGPYEIVVTEQPNVRSGNAVTIEVDSNFVYETVLQRRHPPIEEIAKEGVEVVKNYLLWLQLVRP